MLEQPNHTTAANGHRYVYTAAGQSIDAIMVDEGWAYAQAQTGYHRVILTEMAGMVTRHAGRLRHPVARSVLDGSEGRDSPPVVPPTGTPIRFTTGDACPWPMRHWALFVTVRSRTRRTERGPAGLERRIEQCKQPLPPPPLSFGGRWRPYTGPSTVATGTSRQGRPCPPRARLAPQRDALGRGWGPEHHVGTLQRHGRWPPGCCRGDRFSSPARLAEWTMEVGLPVIEGAVTALTFS